MHLQHLHIMPDRESLINIIINHNLEDPNIRLLSELIDSENLLLEQSPFVVINCIRYLEIKSQQQEFTTQDYQHYISKLTELVRCNHDLDYQTIFEKAIDLVPYSENIRFDDVFGLLMASEIRIEVYLTKKVDWIKSFLQTNQAKSQFDGFNFQIHDVDSFINYLNDMDIIENQDIVKVETPEGEIKKMPKGSTIIDFAYKIHTHLGHCCHQAIVNREKVSLDRELKNGDLVEIIKNANEEENPKLEWYSFAKTSKAKRKIMHWHKKNNIELGKELIYREFGGIYHPYGDIYRYAASKLNCENINLLHEKLGRQDIDINQIRLRVDEYINALTGAINFTTVTEENIPVKNLDYSTIKDSDGNDYLPDDFTISCCCSPMPEDSIIGSFSSTNKFIRIHKSSCKKLKEISPNQRQNLIWNCRQCTVILRLVMIDREGLLANIISIFKTNKIFFNIRSINPSYDNKKISQKISAAKIYILSSHQKETEKIIKELKNTSDILKVVNKGIYPGLWKFKNG